MWGLADVRKGLAVSRGKVPEENPDGGAEPAMGEEKPREKDPEKRKASLAAKRMNGSGRTWLDVLEAVCAKLALPLIIGLDDGLKLPNPQVSRVEIEENIQQKRKRLEYKEKLEDLLENPGSPESGAMLGILASLSLVAIHPALDERHDELKTNAEGKKIAKRVPDWNWDTAEDIQSPNSPKFDALAINIGKNPGCGHIVFVENIAAHIWIRMVLEQHGIPKDRIAILNGDPRNPKGKSAERQQIAQDFNGTPAVPGTEGGLGEPEIPPKYDVVIANQVAYEGINLQTRTCAVHHVDLPWDPATLQQRNGRAWRQGNQFLAVQILYYEMRCYPDGMKHKLIEGKAGWMADLIAGQKRDTNNPGAQMDVGPEEALGMIACDPGAVKARFDEIKAKRLEENRKKMAEGASQTLRGAVSRFQRAIYIQKKNPTEAARLRAEGEQRLDDLTHLDPVAWPWASWAPAAREHTMLVPPAGGSPVYETLRVGMPSRWDPKAIDYVEFGKAREGKQIAVRLAGKVQWAVKTVQDITDLALKPEYRTANWPENDEEQIAGDMENELIRLGRQYSAIDAWDEINWGDATDAFVERMWKRYGNRITAAFLSHVGVGHHADKMDLPVLRSGHLEVGVKRKFDSILPPTEAGWERFLELAPISDARFDALERAGVLWWGRGIPRDVLSGASEEQKAARIALEKGRVERERKEREEAEREELERRAREKKEREEQLARMQREREEQERRDAERRDRERVERVEQERTEIARNPDARVIMESPLTKEEYVRDQLRALGGFTQGKNPSTGQWKWSIPLRNAADARRILRQE